jgi:hypothetical protein
LARIEVLQRTKIIDKDKRTLDQLTITVANIGFAILGAEATPINLGSLLGFGSGREFSMFCSYLPFHQLETVPGEILNSPTSQSAIFSCKLMMTHYAMTYQ